MYILVEEYIDAWNYTFIVVALISLGIGTYLAIKNLKREELKSRREKRSQK